MRDSRKTYLKQVARRLRCSAQERDELLAGLETEMAECCPGAAGLSIEVLTSRFGAPADVAAELQQAVPGEDALRYGQQKRFVTRIILGICLIAAIFSLGFAVHTANHDVHYIDTQVFYD